MIYIIYGASGSGKTTLMNIVRNLYGDKSIHVKGITRRRRRYDGDEILTYPEGLPEGVYEYVYK
jgi:guanylate kinase